MIVSLAVIKQALGIDPTDTSRDEELTRVEGSVASWVEGQTKRRFNAPADRTEYVRGSGTDTLFLSGYIDASAPEPIAVTVDERFIALGPAGWLAVDPLIYETRGSRIVRLDGWVWQRNAEYRIIYQDGYVTAPLDVQALVLDLIQTTLAASSEDAGVQSEHIGDYSYSLEAGASSGSGASDESLKTLNRWKRLLV